MKNCPVCGMAVDGLFCPNCTTVPATTERKATEWELAYAKLRADIKAHPLTPFDLTAQQWYNVCKHWPSVAQRCHRPRPTVGPAHPLDGKSSAGPLLTGRGPLPNFGRQKFYEREPGEEG